MHDSPPRKTAARTWCVMEAVLLLSYIHIFLLNIWYLALLLYVCISYISAEHHEKKKVWTDVDEDKTSGTSETPKQIYQQIARYGSIIWNMDVRQEAVTHTHICLSVLSRNPG